MPRQLTAANRPIMDVHASWWSDARDPSGRYLERAVLYTRLTYPESMAVEDARSAALAKTGINPLDLVQAAPLFAKFQGVTNASQMSEEDTAALLALPEAQDLFSKPGILSLMNGSGGNLAVLLIRLHELTDDDGTPLPLRDSNGVLLPDAEAILNTLGRADIDYLQSEVANLGTAEQQQVAPVLPVDIEIARRNRDGGHPNVALQTGAGVAQEAFRGDGETPVS